MERLVMWALAALALLAAPAAQAQYVYCKVTAQKQGVINAGNTVKGWEDYIPVLSFSSAVRVPYDAASGLPTGRRQHAPIVIIKAMDKASPLLFAAAVGNENITEALCKFLRTSAKGTGTLEVFFELRLTNARIVSDEVAGNAQLNGGMRESVGLVFQKIEWTYTDGGITGMDDWESPVN